MIIRTEVGVPQPGLFTSFDSLTNSMTQGTQPWPDNRPVTGTGLPDDSKGGDATLGSRKKWNLIGKVLNRGSPQAAAVGSPCCLQALHGLTVH